MKIDEKFIAKIQKYMLHAVVFLMSSIMVAQFLINGVMIKTKNDELSLANSPKNSFNTNDIAYDSEPETSELTNIPETTVVEEESAGSGNASTSQSANANANRSISIRHENAAGSQSATAAAQTPTRGYTPAANSQRWTTRPSSAEMTISVVAPDDDYEEVTPQPQPQPQPVYPVYTVPVVTQAPTHSHNTKPVETTGSAPSGAVTKPTENTKPTHSQPSTSDDDTEPTIVTDGTLPTQHTVPTESVITTEDIQTDGSTAATESTAETTDPTDTNPTDSTGTTGDTVAGETSDPQTSGSVDSESDPTNGIDDSLYPHLKDGNGNGSSVSQNVNKSIFSITLIGILIMLMLIGVVLVFPSEKKKKSNNKHDKK